MAETDAAAVAALDYLAEWFEDATVCCDLGEVGRGGVLTFVLRRGGRSARVDVTRLAVEDARYPGRLAGRIARLADQDLRP
ncbi:MAG TPA: hypothetical protein VG370_17480 [Chloroflexota bacterium]|jgi:hypothetical protein|nr:hypothetical protein [Chloroflexota bacterium]